MLQLRDLLKGVARSDWEAKKKVRQRAMYLSLAFTLLVRHHEARSSTVQYYRDPAWIAHYELASRTLGVSSIEPWEVSYEMVDD